MCGRAYSTFTDDELYLRYLGKKPPVFHPMKPNFNFSPSQVSPVIRSTPGVPGSREIALARWGLIPFWAKDPSIAYKMINARSETVTEKPSFRAAFQSRRCVVPLSGFIEWKREGKAKRPFRIFLKDEAIMSMAGIWESWKDPETGTEVQTFSILTTSANPFMKKIHDRMPVVLGREEEKAWLETEPRDAMKLKELLRPLQADRLDSVEISTLVNNPRNNAAEVLEAIRN